MTIPPEAIAKLRHELQRIALIGSASLLSMAIVFFVLYGLTLALSWLVPALSSWAFVLWQCYKRLPLNRGSLDGPYYSRLGHGNRITLLRGLFISGTAGFLVTTHLTSQWVIYVPAILYSAAAIGDWFDGFMARRQQQTTQLGMELDTVLDAFGLVIAPLLAVLIGKLHVSYLLVSVAYYLFQWGLAWRRSHNLPTYALPQSRIRRFLAGTQMALVAIALWPPLPSDLTRLAGFLLMIPLLLGFIRDWLHVSGRIGEKRTPPE